MSVRVRYQVTLSISSTSAEERDLGNVKWEIVTDKQGEGGSWKTLLEAGVTDVQIPMDSIADVRLIAIRTNAKDPNQLPNEIRIRRNLIGAEELPVVPLSDAKEGHFLLSTEGLTALFASNPGSVDMEITLLAVGD
jgi:hypothetical protein